MQGLEALDYLNENAPDVFLLDVCLIFLVLCDLLKLTTPRNVVPILKFASLKVISPVLVFNHSGSSICTSTLWFLLLLNPALSRSVLWPTCFDAYNKQAANQPLTVAENLRCVPANVRSDMFIFPADFFKLRDLTIEVPLGRLIPRTSSSSFLFSAKNFYRRNYGMPMFDPEMSGNDGFNATVRYISEHIPAPATFTTSLRISF